MKRNNCGDVSEVVDANPLLSPFCLTDLAVDYDDLAWFSGDERRFQVGVIVVDVGDERLRLPLAQQLRLLLLRQHDALLKFVAEIAKFIIFMSL